MNQYNIYAGLNGSFGGCKYQYTTSCKSIEEAEDIAFKEACEIYESQVGYHGIIGIDDVINRYCYDTGINETDLDEEDMDNITDEYNDEREEWISYKAILTSEDDRKDLVMAEWCF